MEVIELEVEVVVADEAFDIHPPHPDRTQQVIVAEAHVIAYYLHDMPF